MGGRTSLGDHERTAFVVTQKPSQRFQHLFGNRESVHDLSSVTHRTGHGTQPAARSMASPHRPRGLSDARAYRAFSGTTVGQEARPLLTQTRPPTIGTVS